MSGGGSSSTHLRLPPPFPPISKALRCSVVLELLPSSPASEEERLIEYLGVYYTPSHIFRIILRDTAPECLFKRDGRPTRKDGRTKLPRVPLSPRQGDDIRVRPCGNCLCEDSGNGGAVIRFSRTARKYRIAPPRCPGPGKEPHPDGAAGAATADMIGSGQVKVQYRRPAPVPSRPGNMYWLLDKKTRVKTKERCIIFTQEGKTVWGAAKVLLRSSPGAKRQLEHELVWMRREL